MDDATPTTSIPFWHSVVARDFGLMILGVAVVSMVGIYLMHGEAQEDVDMRFGMAATSIAGTAAPSIRAELLQQIHDNGDASGDAFQTVRAQLERIREVNGLHEHQIYLLRPGWDSFTFIVMLQEDTFIGDSYSPPDSLRDLYFRVGETQDAVSTGRYTDDHGTFISGIAPIIDDNGQLVALLHVDEDIANVVDVVRQRTMTLLGLAALLWIAMLVGGVVTYLRLGKRVALLLEGTDAIRREKYDHRVPLSGKDELAMVAAALNAVFPRLRERYDMLKFLPRHTQDMIRTSANVDLQTARTVSVAVLETDIRGFTSLSENMSPEAVIGMLNVYIREQAKIIDAHGGSIDKYMGDAVLAVFDGEDRGKHAFAAAVAIQNAMYRLNSDGVFERPVRVGVGISEGEVVMGNMGSEERMEHTVIGAVVNLAARLCSAAKAGQIVVQASSVPEHTQGERESIMVKGFQEAIACIRVQTMDKATVLPPTRRHSPG